MIKITKFSKTYNTTKTLLTKISEKKKKKIELPTTDIDIGE